MARRVSLAWSTAVSESSTAVLTRAAKSARSRLYNHDALALCSLISSERILTRFRLVRSSRHSAPAGAPSSAAAAASKASQSETPSTSASAEPCAKQRGAAQPVPRACGQRCGLLGVGGRTRPSP